MSQFPIYDRLRWETPDIDLPPASTPPPPQHDPEIRREDNPEETRGTRGQDAEAPARRGMWSFLLRRKRRPSSSGRHSRGLHGIAAAGLAMVFLAGGLPTKAAASSDQQMRATGYEAAAGRVPVTTYSHRSDPVDYIGAGQSRSYARPGSDITLAGYTGEARLSVRSGDGNDWWTVHLAAPADRTCPGVSRGAEQAYFRTGRAPGLDASGSGRGCKALTSSIAIEQIQANTRGEVKALEAS